MTWIFLKEKASEGIISKKLLESPHVKCPKESALQNTCFVRQKSNFLLLILGFCRKFSTLVSECVLLTDKKNKKAALSVS